MNNDKFHFVLMCNKICGGTHYKMKMMIVVLPKAEYDTWMKGKSEKTFKNSFMPVVEEAPAGEEVAEAAQPLEGEEKSAEDLLDEFEKMLG